jgi:hypothetical protein
MTSKQRQRAGASSSSSAPETRRRNGAQACRNGYMRGRHIAASRGLRMLTSYANECASGSERVLIKTAGPKTACVHVPLGSLSRVGSIITGWERRDGISQLYLIPAEACRGPPAALRSGRSQWTGASVGELGRTSGPSGCPGHASNHSQAWEAWELQAGAPRTGRGGAVP